MEIQNSVLLENNFIREIDLPENLSLHTSIDIGIHKKKNNLSNIKIKILGLDSSNKENFNLSMNFFIKLNIKSIKYKKMTENELSYAIFRSSLNIIIKQINYNFSAAKMPEVTKEMFYNVNQYNFENQD